jgi:hypothetical protein
MNSVEQGEPTMNATYDVVVWATETTRGRQVFNYNYRMLATEIKGWKLLKVVTMQEGHDVTEKAYIWQSKSDSEHEMIRVDITERHNWRQAQESLHENLKERMRPDIPRGAKKLAQLGDVVFVSREPQTDIPGAISFTRGNVFVSVSSIGEKSIDVSDIATRLDRVLSESPATREVEKGKVRALTPNVATVKANEAYVLIKNLQETAPGGGWVKIIAPDGELSRKRDALIYVSAQGGEKQVGIFAISSD